MTVVELMAALSTLDASKEVRLEDWNEMYADPGPLEEVTEYEEYVLLGVRYP